MNQTNYDFTTLGRPKLSRRLLGAHLVYAAVLAAVVLGLYFAGDRTWWGTALLFSPRWIFGLPLLVLIPLAIRYRRRWLWCDAVLVSLFLILILGFELPVLSGKADSSDSSVFRVASCNMSSREETLPRVLEAASSADVVMLQECPSGSIASLPDELRREWHFEQDGMLCIASRHPLSEPKRLDRSQFGGWGTVAFGCRVDSPRGAVHCVTLHLETPRDGLEAVLYLGRAGIPKLRQITAQRRDESQAIRRWIDSEFGPAIVAGDFNMPVESRIYHHDWSDAANAFSQAGVGLGYTKFTRWHGIRIDHILLTGGWNVQEARVLEEIGSDHRPVLASLTRSPM